ncbi:anaerobic ribonucleoside-triphosphate reductase activating protein [archaeon CG_4_8_14_3_um_filter_38_5]|nr:MAG: anaerobic ribonucleoside-triphosphate reductase activating protein [archaeon CG06_land_8_20_14_3_00_37_11]PIX44631.1 MAG: anaerobic ribonucleoside-triphosphate reductase activating protein [archaeon CG_4_8_14_3_um_filter_38_5]
MVIIKGMVESSFIDYPGKIALVVFTAGCNFHCHYCHNPELVNPTPPFISEEKILLKLEKKREWLDAVVISGGEPTLHPDLPEFIKKIKDETGLLVKLDTNGSNPEMLKKLINEKLIDYVAMDVKAPIEKYEKITQMKCEPSKIKQSIDIIRSADIDYEFRTTILPSLITEKDLLQLGYLLEGSELFVIQTFRNKTTLNETYQTQPSYLIPETQHFVRILKPFFKKVISR